MTNEDLEAAYDDLCGMCAAATMQSSDGGKLPCLGHKAFYMQHELPVIHTSGLWDGEWTHTDINTQAVRDLLVAIIEAYEETDGTISPSGFVEDLGVSVIKMTKEDLAKVPEL